MESNNTVNRIKVLFCLIASFSMGSIAYLDYTTTDYLLASFTLSLSIVLLLNGIALMFDQPLLKASTFLNWLFMALLAVYTLIAAEYGLKSNIYWIYFFPVAAFFLFTLQRGVQLLIVYVPLSFYITFKYAPPLHEAQIIFSFAAICTVSIFLAFVKARTNQLLDPLISRDIQTGAQLERFLRPALNTEINRADREGTGLLLMHIEIQRSARRLRSKKSTQDLFSTFANAIKQNLRSFDQYYMLSEHGFAIILPHATTQGGLITAQKIMDNVNQAKNINSKGNDKTIKAKIGLASLNVGDTAYSLIEQSKQELKYV